MKASELRIGNLLEYRGRVVTVLEIRQSGFLVQDMGFEMPLHYGSEDVNGIALSEDWLLKMGFVEKDKWFYKQDFMLGYITTDCHLQAEVKFAGAKSTWKVLELEHVHQFQNLYFALKGEELTVKK